jgi:GNAT superfamily N-acetyltransferase
MTEVDLPELILREAVAADASAIADLLRPLAEKYIAAQFSARGRETLLATLTPERISANIAGRYRYHVAEAQGRLVGVVGMRDGSHLYHLFIAETHQRRGLARRLWELALEACRAEGNPGELTVNSSLYARGFYEKLGFVATSPEIEKDGVVFVPMRLVLTE